MNFNFHTALHFFGCEYTLVTVFGNFFDIPAIIFIILTAWLTYASITKERRWRTRQIFPGKQQRREKLKNWKETQVLLCKGVRTPRESPNFQQKEEQTAQRELQVLNGGEAAKVTHREGLRRGSRLRKGETRASRRESRILALQDWQEEQTAPVVRLDDWKLQHNTSGHSVIQGGAEESPVQEEVVPAAAATPAVYIWTLDDFSEEVLAQDRARWEHNRPTFEEARADRKRMEEQFEKARIEKARLLKALLGRGCKSPQPAKESELDAPEHVHLPRTADCVHHLNFEDSATQAAPTARPQLQGSHSRPLKRNSRPDRAGNG